ncbi:flagellar motor protein MotB [Lentisphaerota bacterium WC36G]|nr:hypothetical protein LJT99_01060 [Lentisphaerae bacterium WC36]
MPKKDKNIIYEQGSPEWTLTLGDCMSLLLTFFVLLLSFSSTDSEQLTEALGGMQGAFHSSGEKRYNLKTKPLRRGTKTKRPNKDFNDGNEKKNKVLVKEISIVNLREQNILNRFNQYKAKIQKLGFSKKITVRQLREGIFIEFDKNLIFKPNSSEFCDGMGKLIEDFVNIIYGIDNKVSVITQLDENEIIDQKSWKLAQNRNQHFINLLNSKYTIERNQLVSGIEAVSSNAKFKLVINEKINVKKVDFEELLKSGEF